MAVALRQEHQLAELPPAYETGVVVGPTRNRSIEITNEDCTERILVGAGYKTKASEITELLSGFTGVGVDKISLVSKVGAYSRNAIAFSEVASKVRAKGIKTFKKQVAQYKHPLIVIGAGLGGIQTCIKLQMRGRFDYICIDKCHDFGGYSWIAVANRYTKLQTEKGCYHVNYIREDQQPPNSIGDMPYKTWPSRDQLLHMFQASAREYGLQERTRFKTSVEKVRPHEPGSYKVMAIPESPDADGELIMASAVLSWPGNLCLLRILEFPGEDQFGGYIEYSSFCKVDYNEARGKNVILYGHGAFTIENVRTLCEHHCKKVFVLCRKRNLCGMKMVSWLVQSNDAPIPGQVMMDAFQKIYDLVGFDVWSAYSVKTDEARSFAHISQKTVFGVTDVYFLAGYYGLMEVVVDEIKRLTHGTAHTKKGRKINCDMIVKAVGTVPDFKIDKILGLKEMVGLWVNGDVLRPVACNGMYVEARNFGGFSSGPGFATQATAICHLIDHPEEGAAVMPLMPKNVAGERPAYVPNATHGLPTMSGIMRALPHLGAEMGASDSLKARKTRFAHPLKTFLGECKAEWEAYIKDWKAAGIVDDRPEPEYPYTVKMMENYIHETNMFWQKKNAPK